MDPATGGSVHVSDRRTPTSTATNGGSTSRPSAATRPRSRHWRPAASRIVFGLPGSPRGATGTDFARARTRSGGVASAGRCAARGRSATVDGRPERDRSRPDRSGLKRPEREAHHREAWSRSTALSAPGSADSRARALAGWRSSWPSSTRTEWVEATGRPGVMRRRMRHQEARSSLAAADAPADARTEAPTATAAGASER